MFNREQRFVSLGMNFLGQVLVVVYIHRDSEIRLISARRVTKRQRRTYVMIKKEHDFDNAVQGAVVASPPGKTRITIRIDTDILNWFRKEVHKAGGGNYQTLINEALREYIRNQEQTLENTLRKVIREELQVIAS